MMFNIIIGDKTKEAMKLLEIESFPFTESELKSKFRKLAMINHPDKLNGNTSIMQKINVAYNHIKNLAMKDNELETRKANVLKAERENEDIFELFDTCKECKGTGVTKVSKYSRSQPCPRCSVRSYYFGFINNFSTGIIRATCKACKGSGKFKQERSGKVVTCLRCKGKKWVRRTCPKCNGKRVIEYTISSQTVTCDKCGGSGRIKLNPFNPVIPKGAVL